MSSVREIAEKAGVSIATVSRVLNNHPRVSRLSRDKVLAAANRSRYVARIGRRSTTNIAFVYAGERSLGSPFDAALMAGMDGAMTEYGFDLMILDVRRSKRPRETYSQMFMRKGVRGAIVRTTADAKPICEQIAAEGFPAVVIGDRFEDNPSVSYVGADSRPASREAVEHLIDLGHQRIVIAVNAVEDNDHADRIAGWRDAMTAAGLDCDDRMILRIPANLQGGMHAMKRLMAMSGRPTGLFVADPMTAVGAMHACHAMGVRIPQDMSLVGFDDAELRYVTFPAMTAVCQDAPGLGRAAFAALSRMLPDDEEEAAPVPGGRGGAFSVASNGHNRAADGLPVVRETQLAWLEVHDTTGPPGAG